MKREKTFKLTYRSRLLKSACLIVMGVSIGFLGLIGLKIPDEPVAPVPNKPEPRYPVSIQGMRFQSFKGGRETVKAVAEELKIHPRKLLVFNIRPFNELAINNVTLEFYKSEGGRSGIDIGEAFDNFSSGGSEKSSSSKGLESKSPNTGVITRGVIHMLILKIYDKNGLSKVIKAPRVYLNFKKDDVVFLDATVEDMAAEQIIKSRKMAFKNGENEIRVRGNYILLSAAGPRRGTDLKINL